MKKLDFFSNLIFSLVVALLLTWCFSIARHDVQAQANNDTATFQFATPGTGTSTPIAIQNFSYLGVTALWPTGTSAGAVVFEVAPTRDYAGTWATFSTQSFVANAATTETKGAAAAFIRARISTPLAGGTPANFKAILDRRSQ